MINRKVARRYSKALYEIALENNAIDTIKEDFSNIRKSVEASHDLKVFLATPIISLRKKASTIRILFEGNVSLITLKFIEILCLKNRANYLYDIAVDFKDLLNEEQGIIEAKIKTAVSIADDDKKSITDNLHKYTGKKIEPSFSIDPSIKGGFVAQVNDTIIDASIKRQLQLLYEQFREGNLKSN